MSVTKKDVEKIAMLARLKFEETEIEHFTDDMNKILGYVEKLNQLNTENVKPLSHPNENLNIFRKDELKKSISTEDALENAPDKEDKFFKVPRVIKDKK